MKNEYLTKNIFCAREQTLTPHRAELDGNGEFVFFCTSEGCDRFIKFHANVTPQEFKELIAKHEDHNTGQISIEEQNRKLLSLLGAEEELPATTEVEDQPVNQPAELPAEQPVQENR